MYLLIKLRDIINYQFKKNFSMWVYIEQDLSEKHFALSSSYSKVENAIQQINCFPVDTFLSKRTALYPPKLFIGWHYPSFKRWGTETGNLALQSAGIEGKVSWLKVG